MYYLVHTTIECPFGDFFHSVEIVMKSASIERLREEIQEKYQQGTELEEEWGEDFEWMDDCDPDTNKDYVAYTIFEDGEPYREIYEIKPDSQIKMVE